MGVDVDRKFVADLVVVNLPERDHARVATGRCAFARSGIKEVLAPSVLPARRWRGDHLHQRKAHHVGIEIVSCGGVAGGQRYVVKAHQNSSGSSCRKFRTFRALPVD